MPVDTTNLNLLWTSMLVEELLRHGIAYFCLSPGSRSAPLAVAIARHPGARALICYDERAAAFHALGHARATGLPAVLACTSGTAAAHYYPALIEAAQDGVPLLVLTADRPPELIDAGANQAIRQDRLYGDYTRWYMSLPVPAAEVPPAYLLTTVDQAIHRCLHPAAGPVHLNLPFREPLAPADQPLPADYLAGLGDWLAGTGPYTRRHRAHAAQLDERASEALVRAVQNTRRGLLIVGKLGSDAEREAVTALAERLGWPVFADVLSGLSLGPASEHLIQHYDQLLAHEGFAASLRPDTVLQIGGGYVSGRLLKHLALHPPGQMLQIQSGSQRQDPNHMLSQCWEGDLVSLCRGVPIPKAPIPDPGWLFSLQQAAASAEKVYESLDQVNTLSEPGLARLLTRLLPFGHGLMLGNSLPVREADGFAAAGPDAVTVFGNRGTSGIDGHVATAAGYAVGSARPVTLLCGDLTLFHDLNSLHLLSRIEQPVTVVVVNNGGGGIFSFLPIAGHTDVFEPWFGTPHQLGFAHAAAMFGLDYFAPTTPQDFEAAYSRCQQAGRPALIEVLTRRDETLALHRRLQASLGDGSPEAPAPGSGGADRA